MINLGDVFWPPDMLVLDGGIIVKKATSTLHWKLLLNHIQLMTLLLLSNKKMYWFNPEFTFKNYSTPAKFRKKMPKLFSVLCEDEKSLLIGTGGNEFKSLWSYLLFWFYCLLNTDYLKVFKINHWKFHEFQFCCKSRNSVFFLSSVFTSFSSSPRTNL